MAPDTWLRIAAISLPLAGALVIWRWGGRFPDAQRWLAAAILGLSGLLSLSLFLLNRQYACLLVSGSANCLVDGAGLLGLFLLDAFFVIRCLVPPDQRKKRDFILMLSMSGALGGIGLSQNLLAWIVFINLFLFVGHRWLTKHGFQPRFMVLRDDYKDEDR
jgi:NADH:ubiquinone oxidoreductase subunit 4 (subunit M)